MNAILTETYQIFQNLHQLPVTRFWKFDILQGYFFIQSYPVVVLNKLALVGRFSIVINVGS